MRLSLVLFVLAALLSAPTASSAQGAEGSLLLRKLDERLIRPGVQHAQLYVYDGQGEFVHSGRGSGGYEAGESVSVPAGDYFVEVGRFRTEHNLQKLTVTEGRVTVVPSGWVSVRTVAIEHQPSSGCNQWSAELTAFVRDDEGQTHLINSNQGSGVSTFGMVQLPVGQRIVYFHDFPSEVEVREDQIYRLPVGFQDPIAGERAQIALREGNVEGNVRISMCDDGPLHLPAGRYHVSSVVTTTTYPFEERIWNVVEIPPEGEHGYEDADLVPVRGRVYSGPGSEPRPPTEADEDALRNYRGGGVSGGGGIRLDGFGRRR